jgi:drug/metabolite transporter (DMT)-like permease
MSIGDPTQLSKGLVYGALLAVVVGNVVGNLFMKLGASSRLDDVRLFGIITLPTVIGLGLFASAVLLYAWALRHVDLHIAQILVSLQFVGAILVASLFFGEVITLQKWLGIGLIFTGLFVCSR